MKFMIIQTTKCIKKENILHKFKTYLINNTSFKIYIIISFIWVVNEFLMQMFSSYLI